MFISTRGEQDITLDSKQRRYIDMPDMKLTFIPTNCTVLVMFSAAGDGNFEDFEGQQNVPQQAVDFRLVLNDKDVIGSGTTSLISDANGTNIIASWNAQIILPVKVIPCQKNEIKVQWKTFSPFDKKMNIRNWVFTYGKGSLLNFSHRSLTVIQNP